MINVHGTGLPMSNENLLINPWFQINQRGKSNYGDYAYTVDRWILQDSTGQATVTVTDTGITFSLPSSAPDNAWLTQYRETPFDGETHTVSVDVVSSSGSVSLWTGNNNIGTSTYPTGITSLTCKPTGTMAMRIAIKPGSSVAIKRTKLELGPISTLMYDSPPDFASELLKCQRYYYSTLVNDGESGALSREAFGISTADIAWCTGFEYPVEMRTVPTITLYSAGLRTPYKVSYGTSGGDSAGTVELQFVGKTGCRQIIIRNDPGMPGNQAMFHYVADAEIY